MFEQYLYTPIIFLILFISIFKSTVQKHFYYSDIFAIYWCVLSLIISLSNYSGFLSAVGLAVIFGCWVTCVCTELFLIKYCPKKMRVIETCSQKYDINIRSIQYFILISSLVFYFGIAALVNKYYSVVALISNPLNIIDAATAIGSARYLTNSYSEPMLYKFSIYLLYFQTALIGCTVGGSIYYHQQLKSKLLIVLVALNVLVNAVIKTQRGILIICFLIFISYFISYASRRKMRLDIQVLKKLRNLGLAFVFIFVALYVSLQAIREGLDADYSLVDLLNTLVSAMLGSLPAFMVWVEGANIFTAESFGEFTFNGIGKLFFDFPFRQPGLFGDVIWLGDSYRSGTTVYTIFRALLSDFSIIGTLLFFSGSSAIFTVSCFMRQGGRHTHNCVKAAILLILFMSFLASPFVWLGLTIMIFGVPLFLKLFSVKI